MKTKMFKIIVIFIVIAITLYTLYFTISNSDKSYKEILTISINSKEYNLITANKIALYTFNGTYETLFYTDTVYIYEDYIKFKNEEEWIIANGNYRIIIIK